MLTICLNHFWITIHTHTHTRTHTHTHTHTHARTHTFSGYMTTIKLMAAFRCQVCHCISLSEHIIFLSCNLSSRKAFELHSMTAAFDCCKQLDLIWTGFSHRLRRKGRAKFFLRLRLDPLTVCADPIRCQTFLCLHMAQSRCCTVGTHRC